jgi:hypothetical protein
MSWRTELQDGPALFSLRPEHIRPAQGASTAGTVRVRGHLLHQAFHGATELIRVEADDGMVLTMRVPSGSSLNDHLEVEFSADDAVPVRESPEKI